MAGFVGRERELGIVGRHLSWVAARKGDQAGRALLLRGRRRVGKSRLVDVFCERAGVPCFVYQATRGRDANAERDAFMRAAQRSTLAGREQLAGIRADNWEVALRQLASALPDDSPSVVVIDEFPWLLAQDNEAEGALQTAWDRSLSHKPVLLILIGSDLAMMERLSEYGRPFYQRAIEMVLAPLTPHEVMRMTGLSPQDAFDAHLITGGLPLVCQEWEEGWSRSEFLKQALDDPTSPLLVSGERLLAAELPIQLQARTVLSAIGSGERTFGNIAAKAGSSDAPLAAGSLGPTLRQLIEKRLVAVDVPLSAKPGERDRRYRVADSYLRFWLSFLERGLAEVEAGRGRSVVAAIERSWSSWRGRAIEPVVRQSLQRLLPDSLWPQAHEVGGWWPRTNNPEVDLVGADRGAPARDIYFVGAIKWLDGRFDNHDYAALARDALSVPGATPDTALVGVARNGFAAPGLAAAYAPDELVGAWAGE